MDAKNRALLRSSNNPYATDYYSDSAEVADVDAAYRARGNPYAKLSVDIEFQQPARTKPPVLHYAVQVGKLAKADFRNQCSTLFRQYIPQAEKGKLRPHHRAFIERNENRHASTRFLIVQSLQRYDLGSGGIRAQFNREEVFFSEKKLTKIEADFAKQP